MDIKKNGSKPSVRGPTPTTSLAHIAINENLGGNAVGWMENVVDYSKMPESGLI